MVKKINKTHTPPIGCHIASGYVRLCQRLGDRDASVICAMRRIDSSDDLTGSAYASATVEALRQALGAANFQGRQAVALCPEQDTNYLGFEMARLPDDEMQSAVAIRLAMELNTEPDSLETDFLPLGDSAGGNARQEVLAVGCSTATLSAQVDLVERAGLMPVAMDVPICAAVRGTFAAAENQTCDEAARLLIHLTDEKADLLIVSDSVPRFVRVLKNNAGGLVRQLQQQLSVSHAQARTIVQTLANGAPDQSADWPLPDVDRAEAERIAANAVHQFGNDIAREAHMCSYHYGKARRTTVLAEALVVGSLCSWPGLLRVLDGETGATYRAVSHLPGSGWPTDTNPPDGPHAPGVWAIACGLSLYDIHRPAQRETA